jgi:type IV secretory pathway protease TraF
MNSGKKYLVYNHTYSIPKGFYYLNNDIDIESVKNGDLIVFDVPDLTESNYHRI